MLFSWLVRKFRTFFAGKFKTLFVRKKFRTLFSAYTSTSMHLSMNLLRFLEKLLVYFENNFTIINFSFFNFLLLYIIFYICIQYLPFSFLFLKFIVYTISFFFFIFSFINFLYNTLKIINHLISLYKKKKERKAWGSEL